MPSSFLYDLWRTFFPAYLNLLTLALMENILRSDLTAVEFAKSVAALQRQKSCSNDEITQLIGRKKALQAKY